MIPVCFQLNILMKSIVKCAWLTLLMFTAFQTKGSAQLNSWIPQTSGTSVWLHGVDFPSASTGWAVGDGGTIIKTSDTGVHWIPQASGKTLTLTGVDFLDANNGLACGGKGFSGAILRTSNGGTNWTLVDSSTSLISINYVNANLAWAVGPGGIVKSTNGGLTWTRQPLPDSSTVYNSVTFFDADTGWLTGLSFSAAGVLYKSTNKGASWAMETGGINSYDYIDAIYFADAQHGWMSGYTVPDTVGYGMIKRTTDGGANWTNEPLTTDQELYSVAFASLTEGWACGSSGIILHSTDSGVSWFDDGSVTNSLDRVTVRAGQGAWIVGLDGTVLRNNFGGLSQQLTASMNPGWNMICLPLAVPDARKPVLYPTAASNAFRYSPAQGYLNDDTLDVGTGYWLKFGSAQSVSYNGSPVDSVTVHLLAGWNLVGGISSDVTVGHIMQNPPNSIVNVYRYTPTGYQSDTLIQQGLAYWIKVTQDVSLTLTKNLPANVPASALTDISKFRNDEMPPPPPGGVSADAEPRQLPEQYGLLQNYPNPFNPTTSIRYDLPEPSDVTLVIYDTIGRTIATLVNGSQGAGSWNAQWNMEASGGAALSSGLYFYRLIAHSQVSDKTFSEIRKMAVVK